ncbi:MAG TPA: tetratricopeptide repeat protein [Nitrospiraceae bacterium]|nr:tetratricopeptide repeat protein [Nitrospiraceae bacterium]
MSLTLRHYRHRPLQYPVVCNQEVIQGQRLIRNRFISFRFFLILVLSIICLALPVWADFQAGMDAYNRGDFKTALREWQPLAEQGDARAQFSYGLLYENGDGVPRDYAKARQWYEKAAAQGDAKAQLYLGLQSSFGQGVPMDAVEAYMWYSLAAENGNMHAPGYRTDLARQMTPAQIAEGQKRAREWKPKGK